MFILILNIFMFLSKVIPFLSEIWWVWFIAISAAAVYFAMKTEARVPENQISQESLSGKEKIIIWLYSFLDSFVAGAIFYYWWRKKLPVKAKQANKISWLAFLILVVLYWSMIYFFDYWLPIL